MTTSCLELNFSIARSEFGPTSLVVNEFHWQSILPCRHRAAQVLLNAAPEILFDPSGCVCFKISLGKGLYFSIGHLFGGGHGQQANLPVLQV
jgi:hypothetical protein